MVQASPPTLEAPGVPPSNERLPRSHSPGHWKGEGSELCAAVVFSMISELILLPQAIMRILTMKVNPHDSAHLRRPGRGCEEDPHLLSRPTFWRAGSTRGTRSCLHQRPSASHGFLHTGDTSCDDTPRSPASGYQCWRGDTLHKCPRCQYLATISASIRHLERRVNSPEHPWSERTGTWPQRLRSLEWRPCCLGSRGGRTTRKACDPSIN